MRLAIAEHMVRSKRTSPHATTVVEVDMTNIAKWLEKNKEDFKRREGYGISYIPFVMKAVCEGIRKFPMMNSSWTEDNKIIVKKRINLGMAVATDAGLVVPTIYDTDQYTLAGLAKQINAIAQRARSNKLTIQDMQNSTFVVNNPGTFGTIISVPHQSAPCWYSEHGRRSQAAGSYRRRCHGAFHDTCALLRSSHPGWRGARRPLKPSVQNCKSHGRNIAR
jgi:pyruvate/2-oxoglutarate dehydrogenase complex dihydrolipoamide acyltransferase (E2) component